MDHPYFDMHAPLLTKKELRTILAQGPRKTGSQVVAEVKKELGLVYVPLTQKKRTFAEALRDASFVPSFRRTVILSIFCLLLALFMTFTVPGRAFAEEIYSIIIELVDGVFGVSNVAPTTNESKPDMSSIPDGIETPQELSIEIGFPLLIADDSISSFTYEVLENKLLTVKTIYDTPDGKRYSIIQRINGSSTLWASGNDMNNCVFVASTEYGLDLYVMTTNDGSAIIKGYAESYTITITSYTIDASELLSYAQKMYPNN